MSAERKLIPIALRDIPESLHTHTLAEISRKHLGSWNTYDWETFVHEDIRALWPELDLGQKLVAYIMAAAEADCAGDD